MTWRVGENYQVHVLRKNGESESDVLWGRGELSWVSFPRYFNDAGISQSSHFLLTFSFGQGFSIKIQKIWERPNVLLLQHVAVVIESLLFLSKETDNS